MMDCPVCNNAMITLELEDVEIDYCAGCGGIWLDAGELELLLKDASQAKELLESFEIDKQSREKARKCPICFKKMYKVSVGQGDSRVLIDKCRKNDGLWFDKGELKDILTKAKLDKESKIQKILSKMFGTEKE